MAIAVPFPAEEPPICFTYSKVGFWALRFVAGKKLANSAESKILVFMVQFFISFNATLFPCSSIVSRKQIPLG